jgi:hypothetical protein
MTTCHIAFWRGVERAAEFEHCRYPTREKGKPHIHNLLREMMPDPWAEGWTECRFAVASWDGQTAREVPALAAMGSLARRIGH